MIWGPDRIRPRRAVCSMDGSRPDDRYVRAACVERERRGETIPGCKRSPTEFGQPAKFGQLYSRPNVVGVHAKLKRTFLPLHGAVPVPGTLYSTGTCISGAAGGTVDSRISGCRHSAKVNSIFFYFFLTATLWKMSERPTQTVYCIGCHTLE